MTNLIASMTTLNADHVETLMIALHSTLDDLPRASFVETIALAERMGADRLAEFHAQQCD